MGVRNQDFSGDLSNKKELGICWNLREDVFFFKLMLEAVTLTKGVILSMISSIYDPLGSAALLYLKEEEFYKDFSIKTYSGKVKSVVL